MSAEPTTFGGPAHYLMCMRSSRHSQMSDVGRENGGAGGFQYTKPFCVEISQYQRSLAAAYLRCPQAKHANEWGLGEIAVDCTRVLSEVYDQLMLFVSTGPESNLSIYAIVYLAIGQTTLQKGVLKDSICPKFTYVQVAPF